MKDTLVKNNIEWIKNINELCSSLSKNNSLSKYVQERIYDELTNDYLNHETIYYTNDFTKITDRINSIINDTLNPQIINDPTSSNFILEGDIPNFDENEGNHFEDGIKAKLNSSYGRDDLRQLENFNFSKSNNLNKSITTNRFQIESLFKKVELFSPNDKLIVTNQIDINLYKLLLSNKELLKTLNWRTFELLLADMLETSGYTIDLMQGTKDGGIDIIAFSKNEIFGNEKYLIQAKRYKNKVGVEPVRSLLFNQNHHKVTKACLATTSNFTKGAWDLANLYKWQLELKDFDSISKWMRKSFETKSFITTPNNVYEK